VSREIFLGFEKAVSFTQRAPKTYGKKTKLFWMKMRHICDEKRGCSSGQEQKG